MELAEDFLDRAIVAHLPALIKAMPMDVSGRRIVEVEASTEQIDADGDVVLQKALTDSANEFVAFGHLDIDHLSEFGTRMGIKDPSSYIVGKPMEVRAAAGGRTFVKGEISRSPTGTFDPKINRYDEFWASLQRDPPEVWYSSIYGFPKSIESCKAGVCSNGATRYVIKAIDWKSLAFTRTPKNTALRSPTVILAKAFMTELAKSFPETDLAHDVPTIEQPNTMNGVWDMRACAKCGVHTAPSTVGYKHHFAKCLGFGDGASDLYAHAIMHKHRLTSQFPVT